MKPDRKKLLERARNGEERALFNRALDLGEAVLTSGVTQLTGFYDPYRAGLIISLSKALPGLAATPAGGYKGAERVCLALHPVGVEPLWTDYDFALIAIKGNFKRAGVKYRDVQGALMGLGLKREKFGDIRLSDGEVQVVTTGDVAPYVAANLNKVGRVRVVVEITTCEGLRPPEHPFKEIKATVSSLRLDSVAAACFSTSRSKIVRDIEAEQLSVNWQVCSDPATPVGEGDTISARGRGRAVVAGVKGPLKSGRMGVVINKYV